MTIESCTYCSTRSRFNTFVYEAQAVLCTECTGRFFEHYNMVTQCERCGTDFYKINFQGPDMCVACINKKQSDTKVCPDRMMLIYKSYHKSDDKDIRMARAREWVRSHYNLQPSEATAVKIKEVAESFGLPLKEAITKMVEYTLSDEAINEIVKLSREQGMELFDARMADSILKAKGVASVYVKTYCDSHNDEIICQYKDDPYADSVPF